MEVGEGGKEESVKAHVSTTCVPCVLMTLMVWPALRGTAMPWRAGMVVGAIIEKMSPD